MKFIVFIISVDGVNSYFLLKLNVTQKKKISIFINSFNLAKLNVLHVHHQRCGLTVYTWRTSQARQKKKITHGNHSIFFIVCVCESWLDVSTGANGMDVAFRFDFGFDFFFFNGKIDCYALFIRLGIKNQFIVSQILCLTIDFTVQKIRFILFLQRLVHGMPAPCTCTWTSVQLSVKLYIVYNFIVLSFNRCCRIQ